MSDFPTDIILVDHYSVALGPGGAIRILKDWPEYFGEGKSVKVVLVPAPGPSLWMFAGRNAKALRAIDERIPPDAETEKFHAQFGKPYEAILTPKCELILPASMRRWLGLRKRVFLIGVCDHVEIMSPKTWKKIDSIPIPRLAEAIRALGF